MKENKLIAEFMGMQHTDIGWYDNEETLELRNNTFDELKFHEEWSWLMTVVDKIEDMGCEVVITNGECTISGDDCYVESIGKNRRGSTYDAVVEFINQLNK